ncbi:MAG: alcohol dehydrogenase [Ignavibacteriales bacterium]|nr:MAG: alcohol dehydrogenase [Ignavibacteriales bacterium]
MLAAIFNSPYNISLVDYPLPRLEPDQLLIKVGACGVCGTDFHIYEGKVSAKPPVILGHEYVGEILDLGREVISFKTGDHIAINPNIHCGHCDFCRAGKINLCMNLKALGVTLNGGFAEYSIVPLSQAYLIPKELSLSLAAFAEPLSCCLRGMDQAKIRHGDSVVIIGGGTIGLIMVQLVKLAGAAKIILIEPEIFKQRLGIELGADYSFDPFNERLSDEIKEITGLKTDVIIECVGKSESVELAVKLSSKGSKIVIFGLAPSDHNITLNLQYLFKNEISILNSYLNPYTFKAATDLIIAGRINLQKLITNQTHLKNINNIFQNNVDSSIKQQIIYN